MTTPFVEAEHPRTRDGRFAPKRRAATHPTVGANVRMAVTADHDWPANEPDVIPDDDPFGVPGAPTWKGAGFSRDEAARWIDAGIMDPEQAAAIQLTHPNLPPEDLRLVYPYRQPDDPRDVTTIGEEVRAGTVHVEDIPAVVAAARGNQPDHGF